MAQISEQNGIVFRRKYMQDFRKKKYIFVRKLKKISNRAHFENIIIAQKNKKKSGRRCVVRRFFGFLLSKIREDCNCPPSRQ